MNPISYMFREFWKYSKGRRGWVIFGISLAVLAILVDLLAPLVLAALFNVIQLEGVHAGNIHQILMLGFLMLLMSPLKWSFHGPSRLIERTNAFYIKLKYKQFLLDGTMTIPFGWHIDHHSGDTIDKVNNASHALFTFSDALFTTLHPILELIGALIALLIFDWKASVVAVFMTVMIIKTISEFDRRLALLHKEVLVYDNKVAGKIHDVISNIVTVIILRLEKAVSKNIVKTMKKVWKTYKKRFWLNELKWFVVSFSTKFMQIAVLLSYLLTRYFQGEMVYIGAIYALNSYARRLNSVSSRFGMRYDQVVRNKVAMEAVQPIVEEFEYRKKRKQILPSRWKIMQFENLFFTYLDPKKKKHHVDDVNLELHKGDRVGLIGESGSGKTTLLKLIRGLYVQDSGHIYVDGKEISLEELGNHITLIPQDPEIFATTIRENITMGLPYDDRELKKYIKMAGFDKVLPRLPKGLDSHVKEKGVSLSGGEKQRLALARGLLAAENSDIILLDESTSSVDAATEIDIYKNIFKHYKKHTIIASIHRLHLLRRFDYVYQFRHGRLIDEGTFNQLLKRKDFKAMWKKYTSKKAQ